MKKHRNPIPSIDAVIEKDEKIVLIKRRIIPFIGKLALPGGHVEPGETVEHATIREAKEETGLKIRLKEILGVYSDPKRNPLKPTLAVVFCSDSIGGKLKAGSDAKEAKWFKLNEINFKNLAFDHAKILKDYMKWRKKRGTYWSGK